MGILDVFKAGAQVGDAAKGIGEAVGTLAKDIRQAITGEISPEKKAEINLKLTEMESAAMLAQNEVNKIEAASPKLWVSGWRPYLGWICGTILGVNYIPRAVAYAAMWVRAVIQAGELVPYPEMNLTDIIGILGTLLGASWVAYLRTDEKKAGVQGSH